MTEHLTVITPELIAQIIGLIVLVGGPMVLGIMKLASTWLIKGSNYGLQWAEALKDGKLTAEEIKLLTEGLFELIKNDPVLAQELLNSKKD